MKRPTLLTWLRAQGIEELKTILGINENDGYNLYVAIKRPKGHALSAFNNLTEEQQWKLLNMYVRIHQPVAY